MDLIETQNRNRSDTIRHPWELARFEIVYSLIKECLDKTLTDNLLIVDIGCGDLFFLETLSEREPKATLIGIDPALTTEFVCEYNKKDKKGGLQVFQNDNQISSDLGPCSIVLLLDVLEHIHDETSFLKMLASKPYITNETYFIIAVPAFQSLFSSHDTFVKHYRRYSNSTISTLMTKSGFRVSRIGYFFFCLIFPRFVQVIFEKFLNGEKTRTKGTGLTKWEGSKIVSRILSLILVTEFKFTNVLGKYGLKIVGLSNYIICKKYV